MQQLDSILTIPGDSIDIRFDGFIGDLVFRLGPEGRVLRGRAEWVVDNQLSYLNEGKPVVARPVSCEELRDSIPLLSRS